jgi:HK97 family phage major capsid protein
VDVRAAWKALPDKLRASAVWIMHPTTLSQITNLESGGLALAEFRYSPEGVPMLHGRPVIETQYAPAFTGSTASTAQLLTLVDVADGFVVANRVPTIVEITQTAQLTGATPTLQRFLISSPRVAFGLVDPLMGVNVANS